MELLLTLSVKKGNLLPLNYQYALSSWIYTVIEKADAEFSDFLHNTGFQHEGKRFKMFTFSQLDTRPYEIVGNQIKLLGKEISFVVRFAVDSSLQHFITGLFMQQRLRLGDRHKQVDFEVSGVATIAPPDFQSTMTYQCLSPICVSRMRPDRTAEYLSPQDSSYGRLLVQNLVRKAAAMVGSAEMPSQELPEFHFRLLNNPRKKGVHIKADSESHTQVVGYLFHFELTTPAELHEIGYQAGFGEKNSMGFGCVKIIE
jgi:CRISPR-associated endoribonuclease Cas6